MGEPSDDVTRAIRFLCNVAGGGWSTRTRDELAAEFAAVRLEGRAAGVAEERARCAAGAKAAAIAIVDDEDRAVARAFMNRSVRFEDDYVALIASARSIGRTEERARVVAWLRAEAETRGFVFRACESLAQDIERGEHDK